MLGSQAQSNLKSVEIQAVKILADGTQVPLGTISYWHRNPIKRLIFKLFGKAL